MKSIVFLFWVLGVAQLFAEDQTLCPIMIDDEIDEEEVVLYKGKEVFMCCGSCAKAWRQNPDYYAKAALEVGGENMLLPQLEGVDLSHVKLMKQRFCPLRKTAVVGPESPFVMYQGKKVYFFKERDIARKWKKDPKAYFEEARAQGLLPQYD